MAAPIAAGTLADLAVATPQTVLDALGTTRAGLDAREAAARRTRWGANEIARRRPPPWWRQLLRALGNPFNVLLFALAVLDAATGDATGTVVISLMVVLATGLRFAQEFRSQLAAESLRRMVRTHATVLRQGDGDAGLGGAAAPPSGDGGMARRGREVPMEELVPGDIVRLSAGDMIPADLRLLAAKDLFLAQSALTGEALPVEKYEAVPTGVAVATATAPAELPTICCLGTSVVSGSAEGVVVATGDRTVFGGMAGRLAAPRDETAFESGVRRVSWLLIRFMLVMVPVVFAINGFTKGSWLEAFLFALAVAVGLTPEMLPMIVTANLGRGALAMSRRKTIVKRLDAIQNVGAMDVLCTDKTGTLTQDRIVLERHINCVGEEDDRVLALAYLNSSYQTGLRNLLDVAVLAHGELHDELAVDHARGKVDEIPFDFTRRRMSVVVRLEDGRDQLVCKGAVDEVLAACSHMADEDRVVPLDAARRDLAQDLVAELNEDGFRVVAVASREFAAEGRPYGVGDERDLVLAGFIGFLDPPKESAAPALRALAAAGITVKILTGDNDLVARTVCRAVGLDAGHIVLGPELAGLDDAAVGELAERATVLARLTPDDKVRVVRALRARGRTVGFMGDGINDAGAMRAADVGISVDTAVDVAKESADVILLEKSLLVLADGVREGRRTFGNTIKYIKMAASSNFGNVLSVLVASAFLPFLPMLPVQMLVQNLLYDFSQSAIPFDEMDPEYLATPRPWRADDIGRFMLCVGPVSSLFDILTFVLLWRVFGADGPEHASLFQSGWFIEGLASQTLIVHMIRTARVPFVQSRASLAVLATTGAVILAGVLVPFTAMGRALRFEAVPPSFFPFLALLLLGYALLTQVVKGWYIRRYGSWL